MHTILQVSELDFSAQKIRDFFPKDYNLGGQPCTCVRVRVSGCVGMLRSGGREAGRIRQRPADFGIITGVHTTTVGVASTGLVFDLFIPPDSELGNILVT